MKETELYKLILKNANALCTSASKQHISADCFMIVVLDLLAKYKQQKSGNKNYQISNELYKELDELENVLANLVEDYDGLLQKFLTIYSNSKESFGDMMFLNQMERALSGNNEITIQEVIRYILQHPTEAIEKLILNPRREREEQSQEKPDQPVGSESENGTNVVKKVFQNFLKNPEKSEEHDDLTDAPVNEETESVIEEELVEENKVEALKKIIQKVKTINEQLTKTVYGQDYAINSFISGYFQAEVEALTSNEKKQPRAIFLFAGPPGVGKTFLVQQIADALKIPYCRFDMSEYSDKEANLMFAGFDKAYKDSHPGTVTGFVKKNPKSLLLFDEIEKSNIKVKNLFLQLMDVGRVKDNYYDEEISFKNTIVIFTTNVGRDLYEDPTITNLSALPRKVILNAISSDIDPNTNEPSFPKAICSRFASGNVIMFNHLSANSLLKIVTKELGSITDVFSKEINIPIIMGDLMSYALVFSEGGKADARTMRGKGQNFIYQELFELMNLMNTSNTSLDVSSLKSILFKVDIPEDKKIRSLFQREGNSKVLIFTSGETEKECKKQLKEIEAVYVSDIEDAKKILATQEISFILCDLRCNLKKERQSVLNIEDVDSVGRDFFNYATEYVHIPVYVLQKSQNDITKEEYITLVRDGASGLLAVNGDKDYNFEKVIFEECDKVHQQKSLLSLAKANKVLSFNTAQSVSAGGEVATISLFDLKLKTAVDAEDNGDIVDGISKPNVHFDEVIGAQDAKEELKYFVEYLKNPAKYLFKGVKAPKGVLLYGPPGTGKTLLAKAMAGESDVTFIRAEGNQFLKKWVGEGSENVHKLFATARKYAPSILFIDEIDAIAKERGNTLSDTTSDVLTSFLTEMDGFSTNTDKPVFVLAATNYSIESGNSRSLDPALMRRFDRKILVDLPNKEERKQYIRFKMSKNASIVLSEEQIESIAVRSTGASLAELESIFEFALRNAFKTEDGIVNDLIIDEAFETYNGGEVKQWDQKELERTARHEAGHAVVCYLGGEVPSYLTIVARGNHGGYMQHSENETKGTYTKNELLARVRTSLAGRAAEVIYYGEEDGISTGPSGDLATATRIVEQMICSYGMDEEMGLSTFDIQNTNATYYQGIKKRVNEILKEEFEKTKELLLKNKKMIDDLVEALLVKNHLKENEIEAILENK